MDYLDVLTQFSCGEAEESHEQPQSSELAYDPRSESRASQIQYEAEMPTIRPQYSVWFCNCSSYLIFHSILFARCEQPYGVRNCQTIN